MLCSPIFFHAVLALLSSVFLYLVNDYLRVLMVDYKRRRTGPAKPLLELCAEHVISDDMPLEILDDGCLSGTSHKSVYLGEMAGQAVIVKVWRSAYIDQAHSEEFTTRLARALDKWKTVRRHPNVAPFLGVVSGLGPFPALVQPFYPNGNIVEYLSGHPTESVIGLLRGVASALAYMHDLRPSIAHGGVRGANILIADDGSPHLSDACITGVAQSGDLTIESGELEGTRWMAPEALDPSPELLRSTTPDEEACYDTPQTDVYSFGMTMLELLTKKPPFAHRKLHASVIRDVVDGLRPPRPTDCPVISDAVWDLMARCWAHDPAVRPPMRLVCARLEELHQLEERDGARGKVASLRASL